MFCIINYDINRYFYLDLYSPVHIVIYLKLSSVVRFVNISLCHSSYYTIPDTLKSARHPGTYNKRCIYLYNSLRLLINWCIC